MKKLILISALLFSFNVISSENLSPSNSGSHSSSATIQIDRERAFLFSALKARIRVNGNKIGEIRNGSSERFKIQSGRNTIAVSGFGAPGESTISFVAKSNEVYTFIVAPRSSNFWAGITGGIFGVGTLFSTAFESTLSSSEGGTFRIAITGSSELIEEKQDEVINEDTPSNKDIEKELQELKNLFESGLIDEEVYKEKQKDILDLK